MTRLLNLVAVSGLLLSSVGCCCLGHGGHGACYPPASPCPGGACGVGAAPGYGVAQREFYSSHTTTQAAVVPNTYTTTTGGPVALGPIIPGPVSYAVPTTTTTYLTTPTVTTALQPLPTY